MGIAHPLDVVGVVGGLGEGERGVVCVSMWRNRIPRHEKPQSSWRSVRPAGVFRP
jgi:hypothetical protein